MLNAVDQEVSGGHFKLIAMVRISWNESTRVSSFSENAVICNMCLSFCEFDQFL